MTNLTLNGLMKEADYWIKTRTPKTDVKTPEKLSDYDIEYTYYVVFSISKTNFERQVSAAMDDVPDNDDQTKFLKEVLTTKLKDSIITNKNPVVVDFLTAVEYTQPFYDKKKKTYYITAYINREIGIQNIEAEAVRLKTKYESFLDLASSAEQPVTKFQYLLKVKAAGEEVLSALYTEVLFDSSRKKSYKEVVYEITRNSEIEKAVSGKISVYVVSDGDCEEIITNAVTSVFQSFGYIPQYERNKNVSALLRIQVINNEKQSDELCSIMPEVSVHLADLNEAEIFYSYNKAYKKTSNFSLVQAQKKAFSKIAEELRTELPEDYQNKMLSF